MSKPSDPASADAPVTDQPPVAAPNTAPQKALVRRWMGPWGWVALLGLVAVVAVVAFLQQRSGRTERELSRRVQAADARVVQMEQQLRTLSENMREVQGKSAVLEARLTESLGQQAQMRQLYEQFSQARGEAVLIEVESAVTMAAHQLQLTGNISSALIALQEADRSLSRSSQPDALGLRRVLARDIERLKAVPVADFSTAVNRLDAIITLIDQLTLRADIQRAGGAEPVEAQEPVAPGLRGLPERVARTGAQGWQAFVAELRQLVTVQRVDEPEAFLLSPTQRTFARENLRLLLLNARLNLLGRNEALFKADIARALMQMERYFDPGARPVASSVATLRQLESGALTLQVPSLSDTLAAIRTARAAGESR
ncbi:MAG: uroporphyrinogen-III C-methyltransferase [Burkholderiales bacterium]